MEIGNYRQEDRYDAEFHINISNEYQGKKIGPKLLHTLANHLNCMGKEHIFLITGSKKTRGYSFYKHFGFYEAKNYLQVL